MKYIAKPFIIEAIQWDGTEEGAEKIKEEFGFDYRMNYFSNNPSFIIYRTLSVYKNDYVMKDLLGMLLVCRESIFKQAFKKEGGELPRPYGRGLLGN